MAKRKIKKFVNELYSVVKFKENEMTLFECMPDGWFVDEKKKACYWPPRSGKSFRLRALNKDKPDQSWTVAECILVSEGHATYNSGFAIVQEKSSQKFNTSSAEDEMYSINFRRKHPVLSSITGTNFEHLFAEPAETVSKVPESQVVKLVQQEKENTPTKIAAKIPSHAIKFVVSGKGNTTAKTISNVLPSQLVELDPPEKENTPVKTPTNKPQAQVVKLGNTTAKGKAKTKESIVQKEVNNNRKFNGEKNTDTKLQRAPSISSESSRCSSCSRSRSSQSDKRSCSRVSSESNCKGINDQKRVTGNIKIDKKIEKSQTTQSYSSKSCESSRSTSRETLRSRSSSIQTDSRSCSRSSSISRRSFHSRRSSSIRHFHEKHESSQFRSRSPNLSSGQPSTLYLARRSQSRSLSRSICTSLNSQSPLRTSALLPQSGRSVQGKSSQKVNEPVAEDQMNGSDGLNLHRMHRLPRGQNVVKPAMQKPLCESRNQKKRTNVQKRIVQQKSAKEETKINKRIDKPRNSRMNSAERSCSSNSSSERSHSSLQSKSVRRPRHSRSRSRVTSDSNRSFHSRRSSSIRHSPEKNESSRFRSRSPHSSSRQKSQHRSRKQSTVNFASRSQSRSASCSTRSDLNSYRKSRPQQGNFDSNAALDRRLTRIEVTINKVFVMVGDIIKQTNNNLHLRKENRHALKETRIPNGFAVPEFPIVNVRELTLFNRALKRKDVRSFMLEQEKDYCTPSNSSNNVIMTAYLKRFISLPLRCKIALKDTKGANKLRLYADFNRVYNFIIDVMRQGYENYNKQIKRADVHTTLRTVWGRSNQMLK